MWPRETGSVVPPRASPPLILHTRSDSGGYSGISSAFRDCVKLLIPPTATNQVSPYYIIVYQETQLRTDGVHCREDAGTGPVVLKVAPVTGAAFAGHHGPIYVRLSFPTPTIGMKRTCVTQKLSCEYSVLMAGNSWSTLFNDTHNGTLTY